MSTLNLTPSDATYVSKCSPDENFCASDILRIKSDKRLGNLYVGLIKLDIPPFLPDIRVDRAFLYLFLDNHYIDRTFFLPRQALILKNLSNFSECAATWSNRPAHSGTPYAVIDLRDRFCLEYVKCDITALVSDWSDLPAKNYGLTLELASPVCGSIFFESKRGNHPPFVLIEYSHKKPEPICRDARIISDFVDEIHRLQQQGPRATSPLIDISRSKTVSVFVQNLGSNPVTAHLQISPDGSSFIDDPQLVRLTDQNPAVIVPYRFAKYLRTVVQSDNGTGHINVNIRYQSQLLDYSFECLKAP